MEKNLKLFPRHGEIVLYKQGFGKDDLLSRRSAGQRLSELLERVDDPIVVALDGAWGSGKTHFLRRWVGAHTVENEGSATTVYFDAFSSDFLDDPLISLVSAIDVRLPEKKPDDAWVRTKTAAAKLARPFLRIGAAVATAGATEVAGPLLDAIIVAGGKEVEKATDSFWQQEQGRRTAVEQFRSALLQLTTAPNSDGPGRPLIIVIDELDRCRPDYALSVLEVVKHFFSVPGVHFVLGCNLDALEHMVRVRYGSSVNASAYLKERLINGFGFAGTAA